MSLRIQEHISLKEFTTMKIGGTARFFAVVTSADELAEALAVAHEKKCRLVVLGGGSNTLVSEGTIDAFVVKIAIRGTMWKDEGTSVLVIAGAGENWDGLVAEAVLRGLWGVENLSGIPGTVGATPIQNIGAYGTEVQEVIEWVEVFDTKTGKIEQFTKEACGFSYRDSIFKRPEGKAFVVTRVAFRLQKNGTPNLAYKDLKERFKIPDSGFKNKDDKPSLTDIRNAIIEIRSKKFPDLKEFGTAGSFFKNPIISSERFSELKKTYPDLPGFELRTSNLELRIKVPLAWVLDNICGLKGFEKGNVKLFEKQPIVLVQNGSASSEEIEAFAKEIIASVKTKTGIDVEWEVAFIGGNKRHPASSAG
ncbi:MAG: UDP-N-acetylmuramate dehydrogenase [bacterium]|nr:UDP-N-acetylmuramate dehydrogenase [bacterium]